MENQVITIPMEEYKELLMIKGKYEELKSQQQIQKISLPDYHIKELSERYKTPEPPYKITCEGKE